MKKLTKKLLLLTSLLVLLGLIFIVAGYTRSIFAQNISPSVVTNQETPEETAKKHGVTFPIAELGGCKSLAECRSFCEDPVNQNVCVDFAKKKGFYKEEKLDERRQTLLNTAKTELGCSDENSCRELCHKEENFNKCNSFAKNHNLEGGQVADPKKQEIIQKAKSLLGCDSPDSCRNICQQESNRAKCSEFAKQTGLRGGENRIGPGGCNSESTCKAFCSDPNNYQVCSGFSRGEGTKFSGPGGCNSEESCKSYCQQHEQECRSGHGGPGQDDQKDRKYNPQEMCLKSPSCRWENNNCQCGIYNGGQLDNFCKEHPDQCKPGRGEGNVDNERARDSFEKFCHENPEKCKPQASQTSSFTQPNVSGYPQKPPSFAEFNNQNYQGENPNQNPPPNSTTRGSNVNNNYLNPQLPQQQYNNSDRGSSSQQPPPYPQSNQQQNKPPEQKPAENKPPENNPPPENKPPENKPPENNPPPENKPPEVKGESTSYPTDILQIVIQVLTNLLKSNN